MKVSYFFLLLFFLFSCEDSEVCEEDYTPLLYIEFKNKSTGNATNLTNCFVVLKDNSNIERNYKFVNNSTIKLPIGFENSTKTRTITLFLEENAVDTQKLLINLNYEIKPKYVSKACGFRYTFEQFEINTTQLGFAVEVSKNTNKIENEFSPHITIFD